MRRKITNILVTVSMDGIREVTLCFDSKHQSEITISYEDAKKLLQVINSPETFFSHKRPEKVPNKLPADVA